MKFLQTPFNYLLLSTGLLFFDGYALVQVFFSELDLLTKFMVFCGIAGLAWIISFVIWFFFVKKTTMSRAKVLIFQSLFFFGLTIAIASIGNDSLQLKKSDFVNSCWTSNDVGLSLTFYIDSVEILHYESRGSYKMKYELINKDVMRLHDEIDTILLEDLKIKGSLWATVDGERAEFSSCDEQ